MPAPHLHATLRTLLVAALAALIALPSVAQWKWRDARGQTHVSDLPPPRDIPDKDVLQRPAARQAASAAATARAPAQAASAVVANAASAPARAASEVEVDARRRREADEAARRARATEERNAAIRHENCQRARAHLASLESGQRIVRSNARGEREVLDDDARALEVRRAREVIAADCG